MSDMNKSHPHDLDEENESRAAAADSPSDAESAAEAASEAGGEDGGAPGRDPVAEAAAAEAADHAATEEGFSHLEHELEEMRERVLRAAADAENVRKRAAREVSDAKAYAVTSFARDLLAVADNMDRALQAVTPAMRETMSEAGAGLVAGVEMTRKELHDAFARHGVTPVDSTPGARFDPNVHQAVAQVPSDIDKDCIVDTVQSGWVLGERILRAAMVAVSSGPAATPAAGGDGEEGGVDAPADQGAPPPGGRIDTTI